MTISDLKGLCEHYYIVPHRSLVLSGNLAVIFCYENKLFYVGHALNFDKEAFKDDYISTSSYERLWCKGLTDEMESPQKA